MYRDRVIRNRFLDTNMEKSRGSHCRDSSLSSAKIKGPHARKSIGPIYLSRECSRRRIAPMVGLFARIHGRRKQREGGFFWLSLPPPWSHSSVSGGNPSARAEILDNNLLFARERFSPTKLFRLNGHEYPSNNLLLGALLGV